MGIEAKRVKQASRKAAARKMRLGEDRFCRSCRSIVVLLSKKAVKYGPLRRICSRFIISLTGS